MKTTLTIIAALAAGSSSASGQSGALEPLLPSGYAVLARAHVIAGRPARTFEIVALGRADEARRANTGGAPARPLMIFEKRGGRPKLVGRNDDVVLRADEGGQCDPFIDGDATIATKGRYFTVENGVACGQHWTDFITFRFDDRAGFVFDNERMESWSLNSSSDPDAEVLVRDGRPRVVRDRPSRVTPFDRWRRAR